MPSIPFAQIWTVQDRAHKSTVYNASRTPPSFLPLMEGGGSELVIMQAQIWTALNRALKSTIHNTGRTPPSVLPLMEGGGSELGVKKRTEICGQKSSAQINGS
jgi:hypothetical protein